MLAMLNGKSLTEVLWLAASLALIDLVNWVILTVGL